MKNPPKSFATKLIHAGEQRIDGAVRLPVFQTAMFEYSGDDPRGARYIRYLNNPNQVALSDKLAALEGAETGLVTGSGMAAISAALLTLLRPGDHFLAFDCLYGGTHDLVTGMLESFDITHTFIAGDRPETWTQMLRNNTKAVYAETITNPLLRVSDHDALIAFCKDNGLTSIIDNTFASPVLYRPAEAGYDLSLHSMTKYINGHSDVVAGAILGSSDTINAIRHTLHSLGGALDPHAAFLVNRGINTLALRVRHQGNSALKIARFLEAHPKIDRVVHPGLVSHPDHELARKHLDGFGAMITFEVAGGLTVAEKFLEALDIPIMAPSLGGPETVMTRPAITSHAGLTADARRSLGISDALIRCSIGLEDSDDLIEDFTQALG